MSIRRRIEITLGIVLFLHVFTAVMGHGGLEKSQLDFKRYEEVNSDTIMVLSIDRKVIELQRSVSSYMLTGHASIAGRVRALLQEAGGLIEAAANDTKQPEVSAQLVTMLGRIRVYGENFEKVAADRATRVRLLHDEMLPTSAQILSLLDRARADNPETEFLIRETSENLLRGESAALRYFETPNRSGVDRALEHLRTAEALAAEIGPGAIEGDVPALIGQYRQAFFDSVKATRGYYHLVNVVLASEAAELLSLSSEIRYASLDRRDALRESMQAGAKRFQMLSNGIALLTVLLGIAMAWMMIRAIVKPIVGITETLRRLSRGESVEGIGGSARTDEIGDMSRAAEVFRVKNIETEQLLEESQRMREDLEQRNVEMTQFVYTVSHDLKSPLVTILGYSGLLRKQIINTEYEDLVRTSTHIHDAGMRMSQTLDDLLKLSKIGTIVRAPQRLDLRAICESVIADLHQEIVDSDATIDLPPGMPPLLADELRVRQVVQNLIHNAIKYGAAGDEAPQIRVTAELNNGTLDLAVSDSGPGVASEYGERIFGIFQQLNAETPGTGAGLAIVKKIAEAHGGRAWVESARGEGATFHVSFPNQTPSKRAA